MTKTRLEKIYGIALLVILAGIVVHAPLSVGLGVLFPDFSILIKSWKEILMLMLVPLACFIASKRHVWRELASDWIFRIIVVYAVLHIVLAAISWQGAASVAGLAIDLRYVLFFGLVYMAVRLMPTLRRYVIVTATIGAFIVVGFAVTQLFLPPDILKYIGYSKDTIVPYLTVDKNPDYIRVNSTLRGPNPLGAYAGMVLGLVAALYVRSKISLRSRPMVWGAGIMALCAAIALWVSYSRSALVAGMVTVLVVLAVGVLRNVSRRGWIVTIAVIFALAGGLFAARNTAFISNVILHENPNGGSQISSNDGHIESLEYGFGQLMREPFGSGVGSTGSASLLSDSPVIVENQYLFVAHESGWLGLGLFTVLFAIALIRLYRRRADWLSLGIFASGIGLGLVGILLPVWVDDTVSIVWWGLAATALAGGYYGRKSTKQKAA